MSPFPTLVTPPAGDQRPETTSPRAIARAVKGHIGSVMAWLKPTRPCESEADITAVLTSAVARGRLDGFRISKVLAGDFGWNVDMALCRIMADIAASIPLAVRLETHEWVARAAVRIPAAEGDKVEYRDEGRPCSGVVVTRHPAQAYAIVRPMIGLQPGDDLKRVNAETIYANVTRGRYASRDAGGVVSGDPAVIALLIHDESPLV